MIDGTFDASRYRWKEVTGRPGSKCKINDAEMNVVAEITIDSLVADFEADHRIACASGLSARI